MNTKHPNQTLRVWLRALAAAAQRREGEDCTRVVRILENGIVLRVIDGGKCRKENKE